jgi:anti-sigma regulatory factor (Ser/Thr protein kinase)
MARVDLASLTQWITVAAQQFPGDLATQVAERSGVTRATAQKTLKRLIELQWLVRSGTPRKPCYEPGLLRQVVRRYPLEGLDEDVPWARDFAPHFVLPDEVRRLAQHAFTELLNNAVDHSEGSSVTVSMRQTASHLQLLVSDDGRGVFNKISEVFKIADPSMAMLELSKGKLTSQPERHTGRGLFFTSKMADVFDLHANETAYQHREWEEGLWQRGRPVCRTGTSVFVAFSLETRRSVDEVLRKFSVDGQGYDFERTQVALKMLLEGQAGLESRSQAKRVGARLQQFKHADIDFDGISDVGHAFADELFRVFARQHPQLRLMPLNMGPRVAALVKTVIESA